jgi:glycosyltransferase involved in cell wall biosynthesis
LARKALLRVLIPRRTTAWTIGSQNERFWKGEVGLHNLVRIPYETPVLPGLLDSASVPRRETDPERVHVTYVGRLVDIKGIEDLVCAFAVLDHDAYAEWKLTVVGDGPMREKLRALAAEDRRVRFVGALPYEALGQHMLQCDVLVLPSTTEPWGLVVNEALGLGLYVIASDRVGAADDLLVDGAGKVFPAGDIDALSQALRECAALTARIPVHPRTDTALLMRKSIEDL